MITDRQSSDAGAPNLAAFLELNGAFTNCTCDADDFAAEAATLRVYDGRCQRDSASGLLLGANARRAGD